MYSSHEVHTVKWRKDIPMYHSLAMDWKNLGMVNEWQQGDVRERVEFQIEFKYQ